MINPCGLSRGILLQWHITNKCNQRCTHCYQEDYNGTELIYPQMLEVIEQYKELLSHCKRKDGMPIRGHINVTGGEPFSRPQFMELLQEFHKNRQYFSFGILTNGSYITDAVAKELKCLGVTHVQVSIDGDKLTHDAIRGNGNFEQTLKAVRILRKNNIRSMVSFTAHKDNYKTFGVVAKYARKYGASLLWTDRLVPMGNCDENGVKTLTPKETLEYLDIIKKEQDRRILNNLSDIEISMKRSLQFLRTGESPYICGAGKSIMIVLENGDILPCRRLPIKAGNVLEQTLTEVYFNSSIFQELRKDRKVPEGCSKCSNFKMCEGGARCISYAVTGDYNAPDPGCPIAY